MSNTMYHHGTETETIDTSLVPIYSVESAIVGIVGTAPIGAINQLTLCQTIKDFAQFSALTKKGYTLPDAFEIIERYGAGKFYVVNVLDPAIHRSQITGEVIEINQVNLRANTENLGLQTLTLKDDATLLTPNVDYVADLTTGLITFKKLPVGVITATYDYADPLLVTEDDIKGGYDLATNARKGLELLREGFNRFGMDAKILLVPKYDETATMAREVEEYASKLHAIAYIQCPKGTVPSVAMTGRGPLGEINFNTGSEDSHLFYDYLNGDEPLATHAAGLRMNIDVTKGYWHSTSNKLLRGVVSTNIPLTARVDDYQSETNLLNSVGITTVFNSYGTGYRLWGNRLACFPTVSDIKNFEVCKRTQIIIDESIRRAELQFVDQPIDGAVIDSLLESVDAFGRDLTGANRPLLGFKCWWSENNSEAQLAKGQYRIAYKFTPKPPGERITNESEMTTEYLGVLNSTLRERI